MSEINVQVGDEWTYCGVPITVTDISETTVRWRDAGGSNSIGRPYFGDKRFVRISPAPSPEVDRSGCKAPEGFVLCAKNCGRWHEQFIGESKTKYTCCALCWDLANNGKGGTAKTWTPATNGIVDPRLIVQAQPEAKPAAKVEARCANGFHDCGVPSMRHWKRGFSYLCDRCYLFAEACMTGTGEPYKGPQLIDRRMHRDEGVESECWPEAGR